MSVLAGIRIGFRPCSYDRRVFSPRVRAILPARHLSAAGIAASVIPEDGRGDYDCVVFQKAYSKRDLALAERVSNGGGRVVFDLCDNRFYNPDNDPALAEGASRLERMIERSDVVSVATPDLVPLIPGRDAMVVDDAFEWPPMAGPARRWAERRRLRVRPSGSPLRLVWQGQAGTKSPPSGMSVLSRLVPALEEVHRSSPVRLTVISNSRDAYRRNVGRPGFPASYMQWRPRTFAWNFANHDVCLLPVDPNPFTICKSDNRAVLALMLGLPVIADDIPSYRRMSPWIAIGDWAANLARMAADPRAAQDRVAEAQAALGPLIDPARVVAQWSAVIEAAMSAPSRGAP